VYVFGYLAIGCKSAMNSRLVCYLYNKTHLLFIRMQCFCCCCADMFRLLHVGQHDDARMCIAIALTAVRLGANVANYTEVVELNKQTSDDGKLVLSGAKVKDRLTGSLLCFLRFVRGYALSSSRTWTPGAKLTNNVIRFILR